MNRRFQYSATCLVLIAVAGCSKSTPDPAPVAAASPSAKTDAWAGQWTGAEGTFLRIEGGDGKYQVTIQNLDGPQTFEGRRLGDRIQFERKGVKELIRATDGAGTGMKWLAEKKDCLSIVNGEGYCRD